MLILYSVQVQVIDYPNINKTPPLITSTNRLLLFIDLVWGLGCFRVHVSGVADQ